MKVVLVGSPDRLSYIIGHEGLDTPYGWCPEKNLRLPRGGGGLFPALCYALCDVLTLVLILSDVRCGNGLQRHLGDVWASGVTCCL